MYSLYDLAQADDGFKRPSVTFEEPAGVRREQARSDLQGFAVWGRYAYVLLGTGGHAGTTKDPFDSALAAIDMSTGEIVERRLTSAGRSLIGREPEGLAVNIRNGRPELCFGLSSQPSAESELRLANVFAVDTLV